MDHRVDIKKGATYPPIRYQIISDETGVAIGLTISSVTFRMKNSSDANLVDYAGVIETPLENKIVRYDWQDGDTATPGHIYGDFKIVFSDDSVLIFPEGEEFIDIIIGDDAA